jgi:hypothetical protein
MHELGITVLIKGEMPASKERPILDAAMIPVNAL